MSGLLSKFLSLVGIRPDPINVSGRKLEKGLGSCDGCGRTGPLKGLPGLLLCDKCSHERFTQDDRQK
jgi:hypothetical protein